MNYHKKTHLNRIKEEYSAVKRNETSLVKGRYYHEAPLLVGSEKLKEWPPTTKYRSSLHVEVGKSWEMLLWPVNRRKMVRWKTGSLVSTSR